MGFDDPDLERLLKAYETNRAVGYGVDYLAGRKDKKLQRQDLELSIMQKKKGLGLPTSSEDYEDLTNEGNFHQLLAMKLAKRGLNAIPDPIPSVSPRQPFFKVATAVEDLLPSLGKSKNIGANNAAINWLRRAAVL